MAAVLPAGGRFTAYLPGERELLQELSKEEGCSENYLLRVGVRALLGLPIPRRYRDEILANLAAEPGPAPAAAKVAATVAA